MMMTMSPSPMALQQVILSAKPSSDNQVADYSTAKADARKIDIIVYIVVGLVVGCIIVYYVHWRFSFQLRSNGDLVRLDHGVE